MIKQFKFLVTFMILAVATISLVSAENPKIATVDMQQLFKEYHRTIEAQKHFNSEYAKIQKGVNERREAITRKRAMLKIIADQITGGTLADDDKKAKDEEGKLIMQEVQMMAAEVKRFSQIEKGKVAKLKAASMQGIMQEIRQKVIDHAEKHSYDFVFDKSGKNTNQVTFFIYLKDATDITANMLKELNKFAPGADGQ